MIQQEIRFFWPLTEQVELDLDFAPCIEYANKKYETAVISGNGLCLTVGIGGPASWSTISPVPQSLTNMTEFMPNKDSVGYWLVSPELRYYVSKEPKWIVKKMTKFMLGWEWGTN